MMIYKRFFSLFIFAVACFWSSTGWACSTAFPVQNSDFFEKSVSNADVVFAGIVKSTSPENMEGFLWGSFEANLEVFKSYKGYPSSGMLKVRAYSDDCSYNSRRFTVGNMFVVLASYDSKGKLKLENGFDLIRQSRLLAYLEYGSGRQNSAECLREIYQELKQELELGKVKKQSKSNRIKAQLGHMCFKNNSSKAEDDPFRYIPPKL